MPIVKKECELSDCNVIFETNTSDLKRGWGRFCCKSHAATYRLRVRHAANRKLRQMNDVHTMEDDLELVQS